MKETLRFQVDASGRLDKLVSDQLPDHSRSRIAEWIAEGGVLVDGARPEKTGAKIKAGSWIEVAAIPERSSHDLTPVSIPLDILFEDEFLLVVNKPRGLAAHPATSLKEPSLVNALLAHSADLSTAGGDWRPGIVHRLDKETTGLMVVAKTDAAHAALSELIKSKSAERRYFAVVKGDLEHSRMEIRLPLARDPKNPTRMAVVEGGREAISHVRGIRSYGTESLVAVRLETGRTHQIRVHFQHIQRAVKGDHVYAVGKWAEGPMQLHAAWLEFDHPATGERMGHFSVPPDDFLHREDAVRDTIEPWT